MVAPLLVTQHMKQREFRMLDHFACVGVINITSACVVAVLLTRLFSATRFKKIPLVKIHKKENLGECLFSRRDCNYEAGLGGA